MYFPRPSALTPFFSILFVSIALGSGTSTGASARQDSLPHLDQKAVHEAYLNGDFEVVLARIEAFRKENPEHSRDDSLFIARHQAVVLAAAPYSLEAGKYWMHRLLLISPEANLSGMYASEAIERLFAKVREEDKAGERRSKKWLWIGAGGTALAALVAWFVLSQSDEAPAPAPTVVPVTL